MIRDESSTSATLSCPTCGYDLTLLTSNRCPECGQEFAVVASTTPPPPPHPFRYLGEFCGHIVRAVKGNRKTTLGKTVEEEDRGNITLRRTTIEEIEFRDQRK